MIFQILLWFQGEVPWSYTNFIHDGQTAPGSRKNEEHGRDSGDLRENDSENFS